MIAACALRILIHGDGTCDPCEFLTVQLKLGLLISIAAIL